MAKLGDLLKPGVLTTSSLDAAWLLKFAGMLSMTVERASELYDRYGCSQIYTKNGIVMADTPRNRHCCSMLDGGCVIVGSEMQLWTRTSQDVGRVGAKKRKAADKKEKQEYRAEIEQYREVKRLRKLINAVTTNRCPKRQGKADTRSCIGKYVNHRSIRMSDRETSPVVGGTRIQVIKL